MSGPGRGLGVRGWGLATLGCALAALGIFAAGCGGDSGTPGAPSSGGGSATCGSGSTIVIANNTVCPSSITVPLGTQVTFVNNDSRDHTMASDPHPEHTDCPAINDVGFLARGQQRQTGNLVVARTCGYHDHELFTVKSLQGTITIR